MADHDGVGQLAEPEELGVLSIWGLMTESVKVFCSHTKLFMALMLTLTLPLQVMVLGQTLVTDPIRHRISWDQFQLSFERPDAHREQTLDEDLHRELSKLLLVLVICLLVVSAFALVSTSAIIYSVACIYLKKITSYKKVLSDVVPRVWKRVIVTFLWALLLMFVYVALWMVAIIIIVGAATIFAFMSGGSDDAVINVVVYWGGVMGFFVGVVYLSSIWHLARVVTVLEDSYGLGAMRRSLKLIKGKRLVAFCLYFIYSVMAFLVSLGITHWVVRSVAARVVGGCAFVLMFSFLDVMGLLVQTVFYFACKAHHHESIDHRLTGVPYSGQYVPLMGGSIPLNQA